MPLNCEVAKAVVLIVVAVFAEYNLISKSAGRFVSVILNFGEAVVVVNL